MKVTTNTTDTLYRTATDSHRRAVKESGLATPGALVTADDGRTHIRYRVASNGRLQQLATYSTY